mgnify:CR=1 FL=1
MGAVKNMEKRIMELEDDLEDLRERLSKAEDMITQLNDNLFDVVLRMRDKFQ